MDWEEEAREIDQEIKAIVEAFKLKEDLFEMLERVNVEDRVESPLETVKKSV